jgi:hypothetical protein
MLNHHDRLDKKLLALEREIQELHRQYWITVPLAEPWQHGWLRRYVLADRIGGPAQRAMLQAILNVIGTVAWNKTTDFKKKRHRRRKKQPCVEVQQPLKVISASHWERMQYPEGWKQYFRLELVRHRRRWHSAYVFAHRGLFELKVEPKLITTIRVPDPAVDARISEIDEWIRDRHLEHRIDCHLGHRRWRSPSGYEKHRLLSQLQLREMQRALKMYPEVDPAPVARRPRISLLSTFSPA